MAKIVSVNISEKKGTIKHPVEKAIVFEKGINGDAHSGNWHRQITLLAQERIDEFSQEIGRKVKHGEFAENITTQGIDLTKVTILDRFKIGKVELEVTQIGKKCHGDACAIYREVGKCVMPKEGIFCRVLNGGEISAGDILEYHQHSLRVAVITLSDRASKGEYEDLSGPEIVKKTEGYFKNKPWKLNIHTLIIPDDAKTLENEIKKSVKESDIIFTTGGTGIGSRDITPEVIESLLDKSIPGIMEYIRVKYGAKIPNALLSRAVAGVIDRTLVYTLPGSVKAVREYMDEILKTVEHSVFHAEGYQYPLKMF